MPKRWAIGPACTGHSRRISANVGYGSRTTPPPAECSNSANGSRGSSGERLRSAVDIRIDLSHAGFAPSTQARRVLTAPQRGAADDDRHPSAADIEMDGAAWVRTVALRTHTRSAEVPMERS